MHVLVTGAGAFCGSHLVRALLREGHRVSASVRSGPGRLADIAGRTPALSLVMGDLTEDVALPARIDAVVHAAGRSFNHPGASEDEIVRDNVLTAYRIVDYARRAGAECFVFFSSLSVNGTIRGPAADEETPVLDPGTFGLAKHLAERLIADAGAAFRSLSIRLPAVLGPDAVRNIWTVMLRAAKEEREIAIYSPDAAFNNASHIDDLCRLTTGLLERQWQGHDVVTAAAAGMTTVRRAVEVFLETLGARSPIRVTEPRGASFTVSSARAMSRYGYAPMEIEAMIRRFAEENRGA